MVAGSLSTLNIFNDQGICFPPGKRMHNKVVKNSVLQNSYNILDVIVFSGGA